MPMHFSKMQKSAYILKSTKKNVPKTQNAPLIRKKNNKPFKKFKKQILNFY